MPTARKLPSGNWNTQVMIKGKRMSFTAKTKKEVLRMAALATNTVPDDMTLGEAIDRYIDSKSNVLSPSTIRGYSAYKKNYIDEETLNTPISKLNSEKLQICINKCAENHSAKSCDNLKGLLTPTLKMFRPDMSFSVKLPQKEKIEIDIPDDATLKIIMEKSRYTPLELPIILAAFGSLRRSEISGICPDCVFDDHIAIRRAMVMDKDNNWVLKDNPKSFAGNRDVYLPQDVMMHLKSMKGYCRNNEPLFQTPAAIDDAWARFLTANKIKKLRFHSLRHYYATYSLGMGVNEKIVQKNGGWSDLSTLKNRYQHIIQDKELEARKLMMDQYNNLKK